MRLSEICIRRPVFATVLSLIVVLVGLIGYQRLSVREYPNIDPPVVTVETTYDGASAEIMESQVTKVLEDSLAGIEGIDFMRSISRQEQSQINIRFRLDRDPDSAAADVRDRVSRARDRLPDDVDEPVIRKVEADAQPIIYLAFFSTRHAPLEVSDYADRYVKDLLQALPGVADVQIIGERRYAMRIWLDPEKLAGYGLTPLDVEDALSRQNVEIPAGRVESRTREFTVLAETDLRTPEEFDNLILKDAGGHLVRLRDVGRAELGARGERVITRFNGTTAVALGVVKQATANPLEVSAAINAMLPTITASLPAGMNVRVGHDKAVFIQESIRNVYRTVAEAAVFVVLIIFLFLRSFRATLIPLVTIPVSLIGAFALMYAFGFSINTLTLLAMVLAIGLVVDDAIVMLENIYRHIESGMPRREASLLGAGEIGFAVVAMTLTLAAVYIPIGLMTGTTGRLFTEFAWTLAGAVLVSGFVALTLSPMMCANLLQHDTRHGAAYRLVENALAAITAGYRRLLRRALAGKTVVLAAGLAVALLSVFFYAEIKQELAPYEDQGTVVGVFVAPEGATIDYTDRYARQIEDIAAQQADIDRYFVILGVPHVAQGAAYIKTTLWNKRSRTQRQIAQAMAPSMFGITGVLAFPVNPPPLGQGARDKAVEIVIKTFRPYAELDTMVSAFMEKAAATGIVTDIETDLKLNKPELRVHLDRDKAADVGVPVATLGRTLETLLGGRQVTRFKREGEQYDVVVQIADVDRATPEDMERIYVRGGDGTMIALSNLASVEESVAPRELNHFNQLRSATVTANLAPGASLGDALKAMEAIAREVLPATASLDYTGQSREFKTASADIYLTFALAIAFIYLVLAAQFESFRDPLIILLTVPLSITGGLLGLYLSGGTLNIYSQVGLVTLIGLITKHGILIVEFANQIRQQGASLAEAVLEAATLRLRPILMTTGAMVLGAVPLAIASGAGAESRQDIGWVIVGGLTVGTFFTLFVIPVVYTLLARAPAADAAADERARPGTPAGGDSRARPVAEPVAEPVAHAAE
jgi:multidrug efflux pump